MSIETRWNYVLDAGQVISENRKVESSAKAADVAMSGVGSSGAAAAAAMGQTEAAGARTAAAMGNVGNAAKAASGSINELALRKHQLSMQIQRVDAELKKETASLDLMQRVSARSGDAQKLLAGNIQQSEQAILGLLEQKRTLVTQSDAVSKQMTTLGEKTGFVTKLFGSKTNMVATAGTMFMGYDRILQTGLSSMGGVTLAASLMITVFGLFAGKIFEAIGASNQKIEVDKEMAATMAALALRYEEVANNAASVSERQSAQAAAQAANILSMAALSVNLNAVAAAQKTVEKQTENLQSAFDILRTKGEVSQTAMNAQGETYIIVNKNAQDLRNEMGAAADAINKQTEAIAPNAEAIRRLAAVTGASVEQTLQMAVKNKLVAEDALPQLRAALVSTDPAFKQFIKDLQDAASQAFDLEAAVRAAERALNSIGQPKFSAVGTGKGIDNAFFEVVRGIRASSDASVGMGNSLAFNKKQVEGLRTSITEFAKLNAKGATEAERNAHATRIYNDRLKLLGDAYGTEGEQAAAWVRQLDRADKVQVNAERSARSGAGAARAYANALIDLTKRANEAEIALRGDTPGMREAKLREETAAMRAHLAVNKRDKQAALDAIDRYERAKIVEISRAREDFERETFNRIRQMEFANIENDRKRKQAEMAFELEEFERHLKRMSDDDIFTAIAIDAFKRAQVVEFNNWELSERKKFNEKLLDEQHRLNRQMQQNVFGRLPEPTIPDNPDERKRERELRELDEVARLLSGDFARTTRETRLLTNALRVLAAFGKGDSLAGLRLSLHSVRDALLDVNAMADIFAYSIESAFARIGEGGEVFLRTLAASLISGITQIVGQVLNQLGTMLISKGLADIAMGIAINANPFTPGMGSALIAAGKHEIAVGTVLKLLGAVASGLGQAAAAAVQGGGRDKGGAGSGDTAGGPTAAQGDFGRTGGDPQAVIVDFATQRSLDNHTRALNRFSDTVNSPSSARINELDRRIAALRPYENDPLFRGAIVRAHLRAYESEREQLRRSISVRSTGVSTGKQPITLQLDSQATKELMNGNKVTLDDLRGKGKNSGEVRNRIRKITKA